MNVQSEGARLEEAAVQVVEQGDRYLQRVSALLRYAQERFGWDGKVDADNPEHLKDGAVSFPAALDELRAVLGLDCCSPDHPGAGLY